MAVTPSQMLELGTPVPSFSLLDVVSGQTVTSQSFQHTPCVVAFICNHCPFVKHIREGLADFGRYCQRRGVPMVAISSNDAASYPEDAPERMVEEATQAGYVFPYLYDADQEVAKAFRAACTPEFYVFGRDGRLAYRGQFDDSRPSNRLPVTGADVRAAVEAVLQDRSPDVDQKPSVGCNIKWKPGHRPAWA